MARSTASRAPSLTWGDPLTTRDAVPRPTPARAATSSRVGRPGDRGCSFTGDDVTSRRRVNRQAMVGDHVGVPVGARLAGAHQRVVVDVDETETLAVPPGPLEVVHQRPGEVAAQRD